MRSKKAHILLFVCIIVFFVYIFLPQEQSSQEESPKEQEKIYGLTVDDGWYEDVSLEEIVLSLKNLKKKPTVRIVMSKDTGVSEYVEIFEKIHDVAYIMAQPVDSYEMNLYEDEKDYRARFAEAYEYLGDYVDIWEVGNEVNGEEWIKQDNTLIADKITAAYKEIKSKGKKTAITFYYENPEYERDMFEWIRSYLPDEIREGVDYSFISYYEDENEGYIPDWKTVFAELEELFPNSKLGIGECGNIAKDADEKSKIRMFNKYYSMPDYSSSYVGGYFWWNYVEDCIPCEGNAVYEAVKEKVEF